ncbi:MAG: cupredoxin family protein [Betaproteobacteria bacterium]|nr:cupredoxin family protein [Betaproteobacteria bacterium]
MKAVLLLVVFTLISSFASAHEGKGHAKKAQAVKKEQKAWGIAGDAKAVQRTIAISMTDTMRFAPDAVSVKLGETIRFKVKNDGKMLHELVIGTKKELDEHAALMLKFPGMEHDEPYMVHVDAGKSGEIVWTFNRPGSFEFACLIAGHYQAGMKGTIQVAVK